MSQSSENGKEEQQHERADPSPNVRARESSGALRSVACACLSESLKFSFIVISPLIDFFFSPFFLCVYVCVRVPIHTCVCARVHVTSRTCACVCAREYMHVCAYACGMFLGIECRALSGPVLLIY